MLSLPHRLGFSTKPKILPAAFLLLADAEAGTLPVAWGLGVTECMKFESVQNRRQRRKNGQLLGGVPPRPPFLGFSPNSHQGLRLSADPVGACTVHPEPVIRLPSFPNNPVSATGRDTTERLIDTYRPRLPRWRRRQCRRR